MDLVLFAHENNPQQARALGIDAVLVDLESRSKADRQQGFDTQVSQATVDDLVAVRSMAEVPLICRVDRQLEPDEELLARIVASGADEILLAMVTGPDEVERVLEVVGGNVRVGIMVETVAAVERAADLDVLPISRAFLGLNDLWIERQTRTRFDAFVDGTAIAVSDAFVSTRFGIGGATHPALGHPLGAHHLMSEIDRVGADFTFLRRSFFDACKTVAPSVVVNEMVRLFQSFDERDDSEVEAARRAAEAAIFALPDERPNFAGSPRP